METTERTEISITRVLPLGQIEVKTDIITEQDGVEISRTFHRHVVSPNDDITNEDQSVKDIAAVVHTQAVKDAWVIAKGLTPTAIVPPVPYVKTWQELRQASIADGGYGTIPEQMEMIGEQGIGVFQAHIASVKWAIHKSI